MKKYRYQARDADGTSIFGEVEARSVDDAVERLAAEGLTADPADVRDASPPEPLAAPAERATGRLSEQEAADLASRVAELAEAGLPLASGLRAIAEESGRARISRVLVEIADRLDAGSSLEDAMGVHGEHFPAHLRGLVTVGVQTGHLPEMLQQYVAFQRDRSTLRRRIWTSMGYPVLLLTLVLALYLFFSVFIVPQFARIYQDFGTELPPATSLLVAMSRPTGRFLVCVPAFVLYGLLLLATARVPHWGRRVLYAIPFLGPMWRLHGMVSLARLLGLFVEQGVPLPEALGYTAQGLGESDLAVACLAAARRVRSGRPLGEVMASYWQFLPTLRSFADWGQRDGRLADALRAAADVFERRLGVQVSLVDAVLPAIMFLVVLGFVLFLIIALMLPLFNLFGMLIG